MNRIVFLLCLYMLPIGFAHGQNLPDNQKTVLLYENQRFGEAASYLESFYNDQSADTKLLNSIAYSYRMARNYQKASFYYTKLHQLDSLNITALASLAWMSLQRGMQNSAMELYSKIIALDSNYVDAYTALASLAKQKGDVISSFNYLLRANQLQPNNSAIAIDFADICLIMEQKERADTVLKTALEADPNHAGLLYSKAKVADGLKRYPEVIFLTKKLIDQNEGLQAIWSLLAKAYINEKNYQAAMDAYTEATLEYDKWGELDYYYMAISCKALKRFEESLDFIEQALKAAISPNTGFYLRL